MEMDSVQDPRQIEMFVRCLGVLGCFVGCAGIFMIVEFWRKSSILGRLGTMAITAFIFAVSGVALLG